MIEPGEWIERFAARLFTLSSGHVDMATLRWRGGELWPDRHDAEPELVAQDEWDAERPDLGSVSC